jgi:transcription elongation factor Elf1
MATATKPKLSFELPCPHCNELGSIKINLNDLRTDLECGDCGASIAVLAAIELFSTRLDAWQRVARFFDSAAKAIEDADATAF